MEEHTHSPTLPLGNKRWDGKVPTWNHLQSTVKWVRVKLPRPVWYPRPRRSLWRQHIQTEQHRKSLEDLNQLTYVIWVCSIGKQIQQLQISSISSFCKLGREKTKKKQFTDLTVYQSLQLHSSRGQMITGHSLYCCTKLRPAPHFRTACRLWMLETISIRCDRRAGAGQNTSISQPQGQIFINMTYSSLMLAGKSHSQKENERDTVLPGTALLCNQLLQLGISLTNMYPLSSTHHTQWSRIRKPKRCAVHINNLTTQF